MSTQQDIYAAGSKTHPPMLNKENYVPWSSRLLHYAKIRPNGKLIYNYIMNGPYVRRMIREPSDPDCEVPTILLGLPEDIYAAVDSCETTQEIWLRVQQMMKGSDIGIQKKKAKLFNVWERFTSTDVESIESYYHRFSKLMNDFKTDYTQLYDFLKYNQKEVNDLRVEQLTKTHDPLALMENSNNLYNYPVFHPDQPLPSIQINLLNTNQQQPENFSNLVRGKIVCPGMNMGQDRQMQMVRGNDGNQFRQYVGQNVGNQNRYNTVQNVGNQVVQNVVQNPGIQNVRNHNGLIVVLGIANQNLNRNGNVVEAQAEGNANGNNGNQIRCYNCKVLGHFARNCTVRPRRRDAAYLQT
ncbi:retrovirus-related pol polyprotein from transposon TNT 1-94 [Tanacetum coccineum]